MLLLKIANKPYFPYKNVISVYTKHLFHGNEILKFIKKDTLSFYLHWLFLFLFLNLFDLKFKTDYFISYIHIFFFNNQKLINYILSINLSLTNTIININDIKGNTKFFYSAGMFNLQKKQKIKQPKAMITILRALLLKFKPYKTKPVAVHFNNVFLNHQSYIFKKLKQKTFTKLFINYRYRPHNGCRLKKKKRIKIRTRKLSKEWLSG